MGVSLSYIKLNNHSPLQGRIQDFLKGVQTYKGGFVLFVLPNFSNKSP